MGQYLSSPAVEKQVAHGENEHVVYGISAHQGWRKHMEDAHCTHMTEDGDVSILGVFDGHGGSEVALFTAKYLPMEICRTEAFKKGRYAESLIDAFHKMDALLPHSTDELQQLRQPEEARANNDDELDNGNQELPDVLRKLLVFQRMMNANGEAKEGLSPAGSKPVETEIVNAGCTAVVCLLAGGNQLYIANAGDSRAVLCRNREAVDLSRDHKPGDPSERQRIVAAGGFLTEMGCIWRVNGNLSLSRAIGDLRYKMNAELHRRDQIITAEPDVQHVTLTSEDSFLVLACDGIWDVMTSQQVVDFVTSGLAAGHPPTEVASQLLDACVAPDPRESRGVGADNMTCAIVLFKAAAQWQESSKQNGEIKEVNGEIKEVKVEEKQVVGAEDEKVEAIAVVVE